MIGRNVMGRGWLGATLALLSLVVMLPLAMFVMSAWLLGWQLMSVQSGSMAPTYPVDSLLVVGSINASQVKVGMPIVFQDPENGARLVTHRVTAALTDGSLAFVTQGDANANADPVPVPARLVRGQVLWHVPGLGVALDLLQWPRSFLILVALPGALLLLSEVRDRYRRRPATATGDRTNRRLAALTPLDPDRQA